MKKPDLKKIVPEDKTPTQPPPPPVEKRKTRFSVGFKTHTKGTV